MSCDNHGWYALWTCCKRSNSNHMPSIVWDGTKYYQYVCIYVDDILILAHNPREIMSVIGEYFELKAGSVDPPSMCLGTDVKCVKICRDIPEIRIWGRTHTWRKRCKLWRESWQKIRLRLEEKAHNHTLIFHRPKLDVSPFCNPEQHYSFQCFIEMLRWLIELCRIDVLLEMLQLSMYSASPPTSHYTLHYISFII